MKPNHLLTIVALSALLLGCAAQDATTRNISQAAQQNGANQDLIRLSLSTANQATTKMQ